MNNSKCGWALRSINHIDPIAQKTKRNEIDSINRVRKSDKKKKNRVRKKKELMNENPEKG